MGRWNLIHQLHHNLRQGEQLGRGGVHLRKFDLATVLDPRCTTTIISTVTLLLHLRHERV
jgi:hypothetical protein